MNIQTIQEFLEQLLLTRGDICELSYVIHDVKSDERIMRNSGNHIYPASLIKICIAGAVLQQMEQGFLTLDQKIMMHEINKNEEDARYNQIDSEYPVLITGKFYTIDELLRAMLVNSHNGAANELIDMVGRDLINIHIIDRGGKACILTRKFIARDRESLEFQSAQITSGTAYFYFNMWNDVFHGEYISPLVSKKIMEYTKQEKTNEKGLPFFELGGTVYRKGGWLSSVLHNGNTAIWEHDSGVWEIEDEIIIYSIMTLVKNKTGNLFGFSNMVL